MTDCLTIRATWQATSPCICIKEENNPCSGRLVDKKESWIANWLNLEDGLNHWFIWRFNDWLSVNRLTASPDWLMDWLTHWVIDWWIWLTHWVIDWWIDWLTDGQSDWLTDWTIERLTVRYYSTPEWPLEDWRTGRQNIWLSFCLSVSLPDWLVMTLPNNWKTL